MKNYEAYEIIARVMRMCDETNVSWLDCFRGKRQKVSTCDSLMGGSIVAAIAIIEDKPVFIGDRYYDRKGNKQVATTHDIQWSSDWWKDCSWNTPKPKTVPVEILVEDAEWVVKMYHSSYSALGTIARTCRKALEDIRHE